MVTELLPHGRDDPNVIGWVGGGGGQVAGAGVVQAGQITEPAVGHGAHVGGGVDGPTIVPLGL